jgi:hypothetical protein
MKTRILTLAIIFSTILSFSQSEKPNIKNESLNNLNSKANNQEALDQLLQNYNLNSNKDVSFSINANNNDRFYITIKWIGNASEGRLGYQLYRNATRDIYDGLGLIGYLGEPTGDIEYWTFSTALFDGDSIRTGQVIRGTIEKDQTVEDDDEGGRNSK